MHATAAISTLGFCAGKGASDVLQQNAIARQGIIGNATSEQVQQQVNATARQL